MNNTSQYYLSADVAEFMAGVEPTRRAGDGDIFVVGFPRAKRS
jgi:hypothetical protein